MLSNLAPNNLSPIESLPDDVLFHIFQQSPQLRSASRKLHALSEVLESHCLVRDYALLNEEQLLDCAQSSKIIAKFLCKHSFSVSGKSFISKTDMTDRKINKTCYSSARALRKFLSRDYCFFSHKHLVRNSLVQIDHDAHHQQELPTTEKNTPKSMEISTSFSNSRENYGLCVNGLYNSSTVRYKTRLAPGRYEVFIHMTASNAFGLLPMRFSVPENPFVRQNFPPFPPGKIAVGAHDRLSVGTEIYLGDITVTNSMAYSGYSAETSTDNDEQKLQNSQQSHWGSWPLVEFEITEVGKFSDIQLNYLSFETKPMSPYSSTGLITPPRNYWEIVNREFEPSSSFLPITPELIDAYNELNSIKLH